MNHSVFKKANTALNMHASILRNGPIAFRVHYWGFMPQHYNNTVHRHSFLEACYVLSGTGEYTDDGHDYPLTAGSAFCSRPGIWHQIRSDQGLALCFVAFDMDEERTEDDYAQAFQHMAAHALPIIPDASSSPMAKLWETLLGMFDVGQALYPPPVLQAASHALLYSMLPLFTPDPNRLPAAFSAEDPVRPVNDLFRRAQLYLEDNLSGPLSLDIVAQHLHISSRHLSRLFVQESGQTFVHYVQERRIQSAKDMLLRSGAAIKDIAARCGFESVHYFTRVFTRKLGVSPARFRRSQFAEGRSRPKAPPRA
ncbi:AraC family transcriptional regulator [Paenibacillus apiarius]|uniref:AraC family transcriptional regulator n=1 Tax=Paenibacillus apiarius TaxID=46240 RepID=A0ABT4DZN5_9BACL|nr:AraC family transcriptional regulator [Paenibacillus apiarius]MCY9516973.1 AraC family transcriptional regulator [Paenibacillus apiarius]MCY9522791.1 AraC family transcriptional regulator [Paenibacillus apiarius]MCY9554700.1 AraC family transcriptional regulator [Paenibacillus apiarius]MCY9557315.1 AraC family transcriptional regulator [Paenibacillus apiarius]MCY9682506.1 AraC family transcriptional regulator [Paenibacillus apiarius]